MASATTSKYRRKLQGARVLVVGGSSGIGYGVLEALLEHEAHIFICSSQETHVNAAVQRIRTKYPSAHDRVRGIMCDMSDPNNVERDVEQLFATILDDGGLLDHIIYTAGDSFLLGNIQDFDLSQIQNAGMVRFFGPLMIAQQISRVMKQTTSSSFTITTGGLHQRPRKGWAIMMSYLSGLEGMTRGLARDLRPVRVNVVGPGPTETERWTAHREGDHVEGLKKRLAEGAITGRMGRVEDVVEAYLYLMKDGNMTGGSVYTNGGALLM